MCQLEVSKVPSVRPVKRGLRGKGASKVTLLSISASIKGKEDGKRRRIRLYKMVRITDSAEGET